MSNNFKDADRLGCESCPDNPESRTYMQQRGVGRPKVNPVLEAIRLAMWEGDMSGLPTDRDTHNLEIGVIRSAYLQNHPQGPDVAGRTTSYYICSQCKTPIDMTGTGLDGLVTPSDGGEFERKSAEIMSKLQQKNLDIGVSWSSMTYPNHKTIPILRSAHNADRAADKQRIAELEEQLRLIMSAIPCGNIATHTPASAPGRIRDLVSECSTLKAEIEAQLSAAKNPRVMKRWGVDGVPAPGVMCWLLVGGIMHKESLSDNEIRQCRIAGCAIPGKITHWLELEPAPALPENSDDMIAGDGD